MIAHQDAALRALADTRQMLQIDDRWTVAESRGFTWWAGALSQRLWAEPTVDDAGTVVARAHAETALLRDVPDTPHTVSTLEALNGAPTLGAYLWDRERGTVSAHCTAYFHDQNVAWLGRLFTIATALQVADAYSRAPALAGLIGGQLDESAHPRQGRRDDLDEILGVVEQVYAPIGERPAPFADEFARTPGQEPNPWLLATGDENGMSAEFALTGDRPAMLGGPPQTAFFLAEALRHPHLGNGALLRLFLPVAGDAQQAMALNRAEPREWGRAHLLGAWSASERGLCWAQFLPALAHMPGILQALAFNMATRAEWAKGCLEPGATHE